MGWESWMNDTEEMGKWPQSDMQHGLFIKNCTNEVWWFEIFKEGIWDGLVFLKRTITNNSGEEETESHLRKYGWLHA